MVTLIFLNGRNIPRLLFFKDIGKTKEVLCYVKPGQDKNSQWKIVLPRKLLKPAIKWFHLVTGHPGEKRLEMTLRARYYHPEIRQEVLRYKCDACQRHKLPGKGYGLLPEKDVKTQPFEEVAVDLIGPWEVKIHKKKVTFLALTIIDPVTNLTELVRVDNKTANISARKFAQTWLSRYPWPMN